MEDVWFVVASFVGTADNLAAMRLVSHALNRAITKKFFHLTAAHMMMNFHRHHRRENSCVVCRALVEYGAVRVVFNNMHDNVNILMVKATRENDVVMQCALHATTHQVDAHSLIGNTRALINRCNWFVPGVCVSERIKVYAALLRSGTERGLATRVAQPPSWFIDWVSERKLIPKPIVFPELESLSTERAIQLATVTMDDIGCALSLIYSDKYPMAIFARDVVWASASACLYAVLAIITEPNPSDDGFQTVDQTSCSLQWDVRSFLCRLTAHLRHWPIAHWKQLFVCLDDAHKNAIITAGLRFLTKDELISLDYERLQGIVEDEQKVQMSYRLA